MEVGEAKQRLIHPFLPVPEQLHLELGQQTPACIINDFQISQTLSSALKSWTISSRKREDTTNRQIRINTLNTYTEH